MKNIISTIIKGTLCCFLAVVASCNSKTAENEKSNLSTKVEPAKNDFKVIAYYTPSTGSIDKETVQQLDQIIYSFLHLKGNELDITELRDSTSIKYLTSLKAQNPNLKVLISLGGWGGCQTCSEVFSAETGRSDFAQSVKRILESYGSDGIDLDWEYPAVEGPPGHPYKPEDRENFTLLVQELRNTLGEDYIISFAAGGFKDFLEKSIEWEKVMPMVDHVNLMSYDMVNGGSALTGHHTALFSTNEQLLSAESAIKHLDSVGVPKEKIVIGAAFYARVWEDVENISGGLYQRGKFKEAVLYKDLESYMEEHEGFKNYHDSVAQAPYSYNAEKGMFATYDDSFSVALKTMYAKENDLGGIMFWQLSGDKTKKGLLDVIYHVKQNNN